MSDPAGGLQVIKLVLVGEPNVWKNINSWTIYKQLF